MKYQEAIEEVLKGKYVTRPEWKTENGYLAYLPGIVHLLRVTTQPKPNVVPWAADVESSIAADWKLCDPTLQDVSIEEAPQA